MTFEAPAGLLALLGLPIILILYLIRSRYRREHVASLLLWRGVPRDLVAHTSWRRPQWELLLVLQLLAALAAGLAVGRPAIRTPSANSLVVVLDTSSSMRAQDVLPTRFDAARGQVASLVASANADDLLVLVTAGARPRVVVEGESAARVTAALDDLHAEDGLGDMAAALRMATGLAGARPGFQGQVIAVTDGAFALERGLPQEAAGVSFRLVGGQSDNVAVSQVSLRRPLEAGRQVAGFAAAVNFGTVAVTAPLVVYADGIQVDSREVTIPPRGRVEVIFQVPNDTRAAAVDLPVSNLPTAANRVELVGPANYQRSVLLVSEDPALWRRVLDAVPFLKWQEILPADYDESQVTPNTIAILDRFVPPRLPSAALVLVDPPAPLVTPSGPPRPARAWDLDPADPLLRGLDLAPLSAANVTPLLTPDWASVDIADAEGTPLLLHGILDGRRAVVFQFEPSASNLPQLAAFPLLIANVVDWLTPGRAEEMHAGPGSKADIAPRPGSVIPVAARAQATAQPSGSLEIWPVLVALALSLVILEWAVAARRTGGFRKSGWSAALRLACVACLAVALIRPAIKVPDDASTVVFAVDTSDSISVESRQAAAAWLSSAFDARHTGDRVGAVAISGDTHVTRAPVVDGAPLVVPATGDGGSTDLALGLRVAGGLARGSAGRVVLMSDGRATTGDLDAALAEIADVPVDVVPLSTLPTASRIAIDALEVPRYVRAGETFDATALVDASQATAASLQVSIDGQPTSDQVVQLAPGTNRVAISQRLDSEGFHRITARLGGAAADESNDNTAYSFVVVKPVPRVLVIEERRGEGAPVEAALRGASLGVDLRSPDQLPPAGQLEEYASVVLANVSATSFTLDQQKALRTYVETNGHGLVVLGGSTSFGLGSYADSVLEQALPVTSTSPPKREDARMALLLIIDNSQSMNRKSEGVSSMQMAKEAAILATRSVDDRDQIGVLSFNHRFQWLVEMGTVATIGRQTIEDRIGQLEAEGGTEIFAALSEGATAMLATQADLRHIILFTDGQSRPGNYDQLTARLRQEKIGLSTIGLGPEVDTQLLSSLAKLGEGRYYFTERNQELPRIMTREVAISKRSAQIEGMIRPQLVTTSPILRAIAPSELPPLSGYIATIARKEAQVVLASEDDRPLLAQWHFGLGRAVAWTSDAGQGWASAWAAWPQNTRFWEQVVRWAMGPPIQRDFQIAVRTSGQQADVTLDSVREGRFADLEAPTMQVIVPSGVAATLPLRQVAPGRYSATVSADVPGAYQVTVTTHPEAPGAAARSETTGFALRANPELASFGADEHVLRRIASETGGHVLTDPASALRAAGRQVGERWAPVWQLVVLVGLALFLLDVTIRRLALSPRTLLTRLAAGLKPTRLTRPTI